MTVPCLHEGTEQLARIGRSGGGGETGSTRPEGEPQQNRSRPPAPPACVHNPPRFVTIRPTAIGRTLEESPRRCRLRLDFHPVPAPLLSRKCHVLHRDQYYST